LSKSEGNGQFTICVISEGETHGQNHKRKAVGDPHQKLKGIAWSARFG